MKQEYVTIGKLIGILQKAKAQHGNSARVMIFDKSGEKIKPKSMGEGTMIRGRCSLDFLTFSEDAQL